MASIRSSKVKPTCANSPQPIEGSEDIEEEKKKTETVSQSVKRRFSQLFQRGTSDDALQPIRDIPGQTFLIVEYLLLRTLGLETFTRKIEKYESTVFRFNLGQQTIFICDWQSVQHCFDPTKLTKERRFGRKLVNRAIIDDHIPSMFANGIDHAKKKSFLLSMSRWIEDSLLLPSLVRIVPEYLKSWSLAAGSISEVDLETHILQLIAAIVSEVFFGTHLDFDSMQTWKGAIFRKQNPNKPYQRHALEAYDELYNTIVNCPRIEKILVKGRAEGLTDDETVKEVFFAAVFNAFPALAYVTMSLIGQLTLISEYQMHDLKQEVKVQLQDGLTKKSLMKMKKSENFILEVLRMQPPAPLLFGRSRYDFMMETNKCLYQVKKDETLVGSMYHVQRDPEAFKNPLEFNPNRFEERCQREKLIVFGGNFEETSKAHTHKCAGQGVAITILKVILIYLLNCKMKLKEEPQFSGKKLKRFGRPDNPIELEEFIYYEPPFTPGQSMELKECEDEEEEKVLETKELNNNLSEALTLMKISRKLKASSSKKLAENMYQGL